MIVVIKCRMVNLLDTNKMVLNYCPNFDRIMNFDFYEGDIVTERLISIYEKFIFSIDIMEEENRKLVQEIDRVIGKYIDDYTFRKEMQTEIFRMKVKRTCSNILKAVVEGIIHIFEKYEEESTRNIYISRWI